MRSKLAALVLLAAGVSWGQSAPQATGGVVEAEGKAQTVKRIRVGESVQQAALIHRVTPKYPPEAKQARIQGTVRLQAVIGTDGAVKELTVLSGHPLLVQSALDALGKWRYRTTLLNGQPIEVVTTVDVLYKLETNPSSGGSPATRAPQQVLSIQQPPFDRLELLALIAGQFSEAQAAQQIRQRGSDFTPDAAFLSAVRGLGSTSPLWNAVRSLKPRVAGTPSPQRDAAYAILLTVYDDLRKQQFASAAAGYQQALQLAPDSATLHLAYAVNLLMVKDYARAESEARRSLQLWSDNAEAHSMLATALGGQDRDAEAVPEAREALRLFPKHKAALVQLGFSLTRSRQYNEAIPVLREAIPRTPDMPLLHKHLGVSLFHTGDVDGAIEELTTFLETEPNDAEGHYHLGVALREKGRQSEAQAQFSEAARIEPSHPLYDAVAHLGTKVRSPTDAAVPRPDDGSVSANVYTNRFFGFSFEFPKGWTVVKEDAAKAIAKLGGTLLAHGDPVLQDVTQASERISYPLLVVIEGLASKQALSMRMIQILASDMRSQPDLKSGKDFLQFSATMYKQLSLPMEIVGTPQELLLGGRKFWKADLTVHISSGVHHAAQIATIEKGYVLQFLLVSPDATGLDEILPTMQSLRLIETSH
jgi:TonB family protein